MQKLKILDLFSGIGGFSLGLERTGGFETAAFCDINEFAGKVLNKHWPNVPLAKDIRLLSYRNGELFYDGQSIYRGTIDIVTGGFPCQPFSCTGKRLGTEDDRYLWPEMLRIIEETNARWVIGENVNGLRSMGVGFGNVAVESRAASRCPNYDFFSGIYTRQEKMLVNKICEDLEGIGYDCQPLVIPACAVGAPHRRDRIWFIANSNSARFWNCQESGEGRKWLPRTHTDTSVSQRAFANNRCDRGQGIQPESLSWKQAFSWCENVRGIKDYFKRPDIPKPLIRRINNGLSKGVDRLAGLGNAVVPQIPEILGHGILIIEKWGQGNEILDKNCENHHKIAYKTQVVGD
jgi:site-specific DNA-cytosine methylase